VPIAAGTCQRRGTSPAPAASSAATSHGQASMRTSAVQAVKETDVAIPAAGSPHHQEEVGP
jgi:hypothetical protein